VPDFARCVPDAVLRLAERADRIVHAGDVTSAEVLEALAAHAPVHAVLGNLDGPPVAAWGASQTATVHVEGVEIALVLDAGARRGREARLRRRFPTADAIVFRHSPSSSRPEPPGC
jgi:predicted phosphodiesterase